MAETHGDHPRRCSPVAAALLASLVLPLGACHSTDESQPSSGAAAHPAAARPLSAHSDCPQPSPVDLTAAMFSVYYHTHRPVTPTQPHPWRPISFEDAVRIITCDQSFGASARRRRAVVDIAAELLQRRAHGVAPTALQPLEVALTRLGFSPDDLSPIHVDHDTTRVQLEQLVQQRIDGLNLSTLARPCCSCVEFCAVTDGPDGNEAHFRVRVPRGFKDVAKATDPQAWPTCEADYFPEVYYTGTICPSPPVVLSPPSTLPAQGSSYSGVVFENFQADLGNNKISWFKNLLSVKTTLDESTKSYAFDYGLCGSISSSVLGDGEPTPVKGGLDADCGFADVLDDSSSKTQSFLDGYKRIKFNDRESIGLGDWAEQAMKVMVNGTANIGVCCGASPGPCESCNETCDAAAAANPTPPAPRSPEYCKSQN